MCVFFFLPRTKHPKETKRKKRKHQKDRATDDDVVEDLVLSSDDGDEPSAGKSDNVDHVPPKQKRKQKQKHKPKRLKTK